MARFALEHATLHDTVHDDNDDGVAYAIITHVRTLKQTKTPFGLVSTMEGFIRCRGRQFVGLAGRNTPVYAGGESEVYYAPVFYCDGVWRLREPNSRGLHSYVTAKSGTGKLFAELEKFSALNNIECAQ